MTHSVALRARVTAVCLLLSLAAAPKTIGQMAVIDPANLAENILQAVRALEQIENQIDQIETMYRNLERIGDPSWRDLRGWLVYLNELSQQGEALSYSLEGLYEAYRDLFAGAVPTEEPNYNEAFGQWTTTTLDTLAATLDAVSAQARDYFSTQEQLAELQALADSAEGNLEALNVANMIGAHSGQELAKLNQLLAASINAQNVYWGYQVTLDANREATQRWVLDNGEQPFPDYLGEGGSNGIPSGWPYPCFSCGG